MNIHIHYTQVRACAHLRTIKGILPSLSSFIAILNGSDSLPTLMSTGAFMLTCAGQAHVTGAEGRIYRIHCGNGRERQDGRSRRKRGREMVQLVALPAARACPALALAQTLSYTAS